MMGERRVNQEALFYAFSLERHVPAGHLVRAIDSFVDLSDLRYVCPGGKTLATTGTPVNNGATLLYRASKHDCDTCSLKARCCPTRRRARCRAQSLKTPVIWHATSPRPVHAATTERPRRDSRVNVARKSAGKSLRGAITPHHVAQNRAKIALHIKTISSARSET